MFPDSVAIAYFCVAACDCVCLCYCTCCDFCASWCIYEHLWL